MPGSVAKRHKKKVAKKTSNPVTKTALKKPKTAGQASLLERAQRVGTGYSSLYKEPKFKEYQQGYEERLGKYAYNHPRSYVAVNLGLAKMKQVLYSYYQNEYENIENEIERQQAMYLDFFTRDDITSAGQVSPDIGKAVFDMIGANMPTKKNEDEVAQEAGVYEPGNLREKMTAFLNAALNNSGKKTFRNIIQSIVVNGNTNLINELDLDEGKESILSTKNYFDNAGGNSEDTKDVYDLNKIIEQRPNNNEEYIEKTYVKKVKKNMESYQKSGDYQDKIGLPRSQREKDYQKGNKYNYFKEQLQLGDNDQNNFKEIFEKKLKYRSPILSGNSTCRPNDESGMSERLGVGLIAGTSSTTARMLNTYKWLGLADDALYFRLALLGWMLPEKDHSLWEILNASHMVGIYGDEDMTDAESMDRTVGPLEENELRDSICEEVDGEKMFPLERLFYEEHEWSEEDKEKKQNLKEIYYDEERNSKYSLLSSDDIVDATDRAIKEFGGTSKLGLTKSQILSISSYTSDNYSVIIDRLKNAKYPNEENKLEKREMIKQTKNAVLERARLHTEGAVICILLDKIEKIYDKGNVAGIEEICKNDIIKKHAIIHFDLKSGFHYDMIPMKSYLPACVEYIVDVYIFGEFKKYIDEYFEKDGKISQKFIKKLLTVSDNVIIENVGKGIKWSKLMDNVDVENTMLMGALKRAPKFNCKKNNDGKPVYGAQAILKKAKLGETFSFGRYVSTSKNKEIAKAFLTEKRAIYVMNLNAKYGVDVSLMSCYSNEKEVLLLPEAKLKVTKITKTPEGRDRVEKVGMEDIIYIYCEEV